MQKLKTEFCIIGKEKDSFIESYVGEPLTPSDKHEYFFIVVELLHKFLEGENIAEAITETFRKAFYAENQPDNYTRFEEGLKAVNNLARQLENEEGLVLKNVNIGITALIGNDLYLSQSNDAEIYLIRKGYVSVISDGLSSGYTKAGEDLFKNISSGVLEDNDHVLISSGRVLRYISKNELGRHFYGQQLPEVIHNLRDELKTEVLGRLGALAFEYKTESPSQEFSDEPPRLKEKAGREGMLGRLKSAQDSLNSLIHFFNFIPHGDNGEEEPRARKSESKPKPEQQPAHPLFAEQTSETTVAEPEITMAEPRPQLNRAKQRQKYSNKGNVVKELLGSIFGPLMEYFNNRFSPRTVKISLAGGAILVIFLLAFAITRGAQISQIREYESVLTEARNQIIEATNKANKEDAAALLANAEETLRPALGAKYVRTEANKILSEIKQARFKFDEVITVEEPAIAATTSEATDKGDNKGLIQLANALFAYNQTELIEILLDSTKTPEDLLDAGAIETATVLPDSDSAYFLTDSNRLLKYRDGLAEFVDTEDETYKQGDAIAGFGSRLYLLDNVENQIWKYKELRDSFGGSEPYLKSGALPAAKDLAIDGSIYVLTENNQILRYFSGEISNFKIVDAPLVPPQNPTKLYTDEDSSFLYLLDPAEQRIMVYYKDQQSSDLEYVRQYFFPTVTEIIDFSVQEDTKRLYITDRETVYVTELR